MRLARFVVLCLCLGIAAWAVIALERARLDIPMTPFAAGTTPGTLYGSGDGPLVVVAHGFAGSRKLMEAFSLTLARSGYRVAAFDFEGHGTNPRPMSGDVTRIDGTTALLVAETRRVIAAARAATEYDGPIALVGHSMATDIVIRTPEPGDAVAAIVAISMYSGAVTATYPERLLIVTGQFEPHLRRNALAALRMVSPDASEGASASAGRVLRRAVVAPHVEHVGVLYAPETLRETRDFLDAAFGRDGSAPLARIGVPLAALMAAIVALVWPMSRWLPEAPAPAPIPRRVFWAALFLPGGAAVLVTGFVSVAFLPVLIGDALALHLLVLGAAQIAVLHMAGQLPHGGGARGTALLLLWGLCIFGAALHRYGANFWPIPERWPILLLLAVGTVPFMVADAALGGGGRAPLWRRIALRLTLFASLALAMAIDPERLLYVATVFPVLVLFYLTHGLMGRWVALRAGPLSSGIALGLILAWALGVTVPLFDA